MSMRPALQRVAKDRTFAAKVVTEEKRNCRKRRRDTLDGCVRTFHNSSRGAPSESSQQPASAARPNKSRTWSCARCTLDNGNRRKFCELCKWPRGQPFDESDACHDGDVRPRSCSNVLAAMQATSGESLGRSATDFAWPTEARHAVLQNPTRMSEVIEVQDNEARQKSLRVVPPQSIVDSDGGEAALKPDETQKADAGAQQQQADTRLSHDVSGADVACSDSFPLEKEANDTIDDGRDGPIGDNLGLPEDRPASSVPLRDANLLLGMTQEGSNFDYMSQVGTHGSMSSFAAP